MKWTHGEEELIIRLALRGVTARSIAEIRSRSIASVQSKLAELRKKHKIPKRKKKGRPRRIKPIWHEPPIHAPIPAELPTYIDAQGLTVKICPTRWAEGAYLQPPTVRPAIKRR